MNQAVRAQVAPNYPMCALALSRRVDWCRIKAAFQLLNLKALSPNRLLPTMSLGKFAKATAPECAEHRMFSREVELDTPLTSLVCRQVFSAK
jgi:hypothetical protein